MPLIYLPVLLFVSAKLQLESTYLEGSGVGVRIRSVTENSYLCVNSNGDLTLEVSFLSIVKSSAGRVTCHQRMLIHLQIILSSIWLCWKIDSSAMQVARGGVGGALFFCQAYLSPHGNISFYFGRLKVFFLLSTGARKYYGPLRVFRRLIWWVHNI